MRLFFVFAALFFAKGTYGQKPVTVVFQNDYKDVYHLSLIIYTPDGKGQTRVSDFAPGQTKTYTFPAGTEIFVANRKQEAFAMKGNDLKATGLKPTFVLAENKDRVNVALSTLREQDDAPEDSGKRE